MCYCDPGFNNLSETNVTLSAINQARIRLEPYLEQTPLQRISRLSQHLGADIWFKREDLTTVRSCKVRGALNKLLILKSSGPLRRVVCASAGNHAQGFAFSCRLLNSQGVVFLPKNTPRQKVDQVRFVGGDWVKVVISGENFDDCYRESVLYAQTHDLPFIHPFDDEDVIAGQGTLGVELVSALRKAPGVVLVPVGGGGLAAGVCVALKSLAPDVRIIGVEAAGADAMRQALGHGQRMTLRNTDSFADGTAVDTPGMIGFNVCQALLDDIVVVDRVDIVEAIYQLNNDYGMVVEPSGALSCAALKYLTLDRSDCVVSVISGGNNDAARFQEYQQILSSVDLKKPA